MNQIAALQKILQLGVPAFETRDISALLRISPANASVLLSRLAGRGFIGHLARGRWSSGARPPGQLVELLAAPLPAYVSLQSALFLHGLIEQVPQVTYAVTLGRSRRFDTPAGTVSFHRLPPRLYGGFETMADGTKLAKAEKALFDLIYLGPGRTRLFSHLPEIEFPRSFRWTEVDRWTRLVAGASRRSFVERRVRGLREAARM